VINDYKTIITLPNKTIVGENIMNTTHRILILATLAVLFGGFTAKVNGLSEIERYNYVVGTQTIGAAYHFTKESKLVETARAILEMGSNTIKFSFEADKLANGTPAWNPKNLMEIAHLDPSVKTVFNLSFVNYVIWVYAISSKQMLFHQESLDGEYREIYNLTRYLLTTYNGTNKTFYLGNWEGDWHLLHNYDPNYVPTQKEFHDMTAWFNTRQKAVDDAKRETSFHGVNVFYYLEVNRVQDAIQGKARLTNDILPKTNVDFVSYSSYDSLDTEEKLKKALDYIQSKLPHKQGISGKRIFIGEYGFPTASHTPQKQEELSRQVMRVGLEWGCPFVLYWEMYNNEVDKDGKQRGFWMIDNKNVKQPIYNMHHRFYEWARQYVADFKHKEGRVPTRDEFGIKAAEWLKDFKS
jgi:hypothetical protein